jgi:P27 family predicted phage terminase small subunit
LAGRPPDPLRALTGTGHRPIDPPLALAPGDPACPSYIRGAGRTLWNELVAWLGTAGGQILEQHDRVHLELLCNAYARYRKALREFDRAPTIKGSMGQPVLSHWHGVLEAASIEIRRILAAFGGSPADRIKLRALKRGEKKNPVAADIRRFIVAARKTG